MNNRHASVNLLRRMNEVIQATGLAYYRLHCAVDAGAPEGEIAELTVALESAAEMVSQVLADSPAPVPTTEANT